jgi:TolB amino-terminal domain
VIRLECFMPKDRLLHPLRPALALFGLALAALIQPAAALEGVVTGGKINPLPIAVTPFISDGGESEVAGMMNEVITNNLARSGYFNPLEPQSFIEQISDFNQEPRFQDWRQAQAGPGHRAGCQQWRPHPGRIQALRRELSAANRGAAIRDLAQECAPHRSSHLGPDL